MSRMGQHTTKLTLQRRNPSTHLRVLALKKWNGEIVTRAIPYEPMLRGLVAAEGQVDNLIHAEQAGGGVLAEEVVGRRGPVLPVLQHVAVAEQAP